MTRVESWSDIRPGTPITLRRGALTGEKTERTKAWTASGPYYSESGVACIRVDIGGVTVGYPLDRVSLGWEEPRAVAPAVSIAAALDPPPPPPLRVIDTFAVFALACAFSYVIAMGLIAIGAWVSQ